MMLVMTVVPLTHPSASLSVFTLSNGGVETSTVIKQYSTELRGSGGGARSALFPPDQERVNKNYNRPWQRSHSTRREKIALKVLMKSSLSGKRLCERQNEPLRIICHSANTQSREL